MPGLLTCGWARRLEARPGPAAAIIPGWGDAICFNELHHTTHYHNTWD